MIIQWKKFIFKINDIYGTENDNNGMAKADVHCYFQQSHYIDVSKKMSLHKMSKTLCIDLNQSEENLRKDMNRTTRYQINKAGRDDLTIQHIKNPTKEDVAQFIRFFNPFAVKKGIEKSRTDKIDSLQEKNQLIISCVYHRNGEKLTSHLYIVSSGRVTMLYSASARLANNEIQPIEIGRANRYLHWHDILFFREKGYLVYDFLGLSMDENDEEQQNINKFKKGFGGREEYHFQSYVPQTLKGKVMILLLRWMWRNQHELVQRSKILKEKQSYEKAAD